MTVDTTPDPTADLMTLTTPTRLSAEAWRWEVPDTWQQGRGAFGGLTVATLVRTLELALANPEQPLRTLTASLCGPVMAGAAQLQIEALREGSSTTVMAIRLLQEGELRAHAVGTFGRRRVEDGDWNTIAPPEMPSWRDIPNPAPLGPPLAPTFTQHVAYWPLGHPPFSGVPTERAQGWVMPKRPGPARDAAYLAALVDAWWPVHLISLKRPRPMATISYTLEILGGWEGLDPDAPLFHSSSSPASRHGYAHEERQLWGEDGRLMALNHQVFAIIK
ncbi:MAG: hypothetical protein CMH57_05415 [Myxococcales bacterium]|nr:hypothetical protein [Myxococcales bacterium]